MPLTIDRKHRTKLARNARENTSTNQHKQTRTSTSSREQYSFVTTLAHTHTRRQANVNASIQNLARFRHIAQLFFQLKTKLFCSFLNRLQRTLFTKQKDIFTTSNHVHTKQNFNTQIC